MLHPDPETRFTIDESIEHPWLKETTATQAEINIFFGGEWQFNKIEV